MLLTMTNSSTTQRTNYCLSAATMVMRTCHIALSCWALLWEPPVPHRVFSFIGWDRAAHSERHYRHIATGGVISAQHWASCLKPTVQPCFCKISCSSLFILYHAEYFSDWNVLTLLSYLHITYFMEQTSSWEANRFSASQEIPRIVWNPKVHSVWNKPVRLFLCV
jgi:hypothetical protein